jgi:hypothetical protein
MQIPRPKSGPEIDSEIKTDPDTEKRVDVVDIYTNTDTDLFVFLQKSFHHYLNLFIFVFESRWTNQRCFRCLLDWDV